MKKVLLLLMFITMALSVVPAMSMAKGTVTFSDVQEQHWAYDSVRGAAEQGYVNGYPDGMFRPDAKVSRAEFLKMAVSALKLPVKKTDREWYTDYYDAAETGKIYVPGDFDQDGLTSEPITRIEMAHVAVRAIGKTAEDNDYLMLAAVQNGLINGTGNGNLELYGFTTRAQAVVVIERIIRVRNGETLPIDTHAVANAEKAIEAGKDPWGRTIRTTDLPKNYQDYPYILAADIPNEMYETKPFELIDTTPAELKASNDKFFNHKPTVEAWKKTTEAYYNLLLNVDYRTINEQWAEDLFNHHNQALASVLEDMKEYVGWVKKNKIVTQGTINAEPSMIFWSGRTHKYYIRVMFTFKIDAYTEYKDIFFDQFFNSWNEFEKSVWYEGYADIPLSTNVGGSNLLKIAGEASLFRLTNPINKK